MDQTTEKRLDELVFQAEMQHIVLTRKHTLLLGCFDDLANAFHNVGVVIGTHSGNGYTNCDQEVCKKCVDILEEAK